MAATQARQPAQRLPRETAPTLQEGRVQGCQGYLTKRTKILKRWKNEPRWFTIAPGKRSAVAADHQVHAVEAKLIVGALHVYVTIFLDSPASCV